MSTDLRLPQQLRGKCNCGLRCKSGDVKEARSGLKTGDSAEEQATSKLPSFPNNVSVFISHTGEQKDEVAYPLRDSLHSARLDSFFGCGRSACVDGQRE